MAARYSDNDVAVSDDTRFDHDESDDDDAVSFAKDLASSSFGTPEIQDVRRLGRSAIAAYGPPPDFESEQLVAAHDDERPELAVEHEAADGLEHDGRTFEAEMRYRRLAANYGFSPDRLAPMLEAKQRFAESWNWYIAAAMHGDTNSLFRLALACDLRGHYGWAQKLLRRAVSSLRKGIFESLREVLDSISTESRPMAIAEYLTDYAWKERDANVTYALGTLLSVGAGRPDLGRLIYSCALAKGHPLAALSLVDLVPSDSFKKRHALDHLDVLEFDSGLFEISQVEDFAVRWNSVQVAINTFTKHLDYPGQGGVIRKLPDGSTDYLFSAEVQRVVNVAQQVAILRGYAAMPCDYRSLRTIRKTAHKIAWRTRENVVARRDIHDLLVFVAYASQQAQVEFALSKRPKGRRVALRAPAGWSDINKFDRLIPCSGLVHRFQHSLQQDLNECEQSVLILRLSGLSVGDVSRVLGYGGDVVREYERQATLKLVAAQNSPNYDSGDCPGFRPVGRNPEQRDPVG
ncbi:hypothetical protein [Actinomycetospora sp. CA-084318]|uniref:hypothetical protein n=1 Tax=Actinomycetospora sp. CA-084318 TaxID=3239892 RepID=UPI003D969F3D